MAHYTDFKLYWELWGGYPDRDLPFGQPELLWFVAAKNNAARCAVRSDAKGSTELVWHANWQNIPYSLIQPLPALLDEIGAFGEQESR